MEGAFGEDEDQRGGWVAAAGGCRVSGVGCRVSGVGCR